jgi:transcriptional regulator with XRE-family HTH domain
MGRHASLSTRTEHLGTLYFVALLRQELGQRIQAARKDAGLSQQELAWKVGLKHAQDVSRYERGKVEVPAFRIDRIAEATGKPRSYFTRDPSEPEPPSNGYDARLERLEGQVAEALVLLRQLADDAPARRATPR